MRAGHPGPDLLVEAIKRVPRFLKAGVDAARAGVRFRDRGALGDIEGKIGGGELHGPAVQEIAPSPGKYAARPAEPGGDIG